MSYPAICESELKYDAGREGWTCRATRDFPVTWPLRSISSLHPIGFSFSVAVTTATLSHTAHRDESASPRKPNVSTVDRAENVLSFDVWWFRAENLN